MLKFCPECGSKITGGRFCGSCGADLYKYQAAAGDSSLDDALDNLAKLAEEKKARQDKLRSWIIMGKNDEARKYCEELIDNDPMDRAGYIGLIRIASVNYTQADYGINAESNVEKQIRIATEILGEQELFADNDLADYLARFPRNPQRIAELGEQCFEQGDYGAAKEWLERAAGKGHAHAKFMLGKIYEEGKGVEKNLKRAMDMYTQAAEAGDTSAIAYFNPTEAEAQYKLGLNFYLTGNIDGAKWWFEQAGKNNYNIAVYYLGLMHEEGKGFDKDVDKAYEIYSSIKTGCQEAWDAVERINEMRAEEERQRLEQERQAKERKRLERERQAAAYRAEREEQERKVKEKEAELDRAGLEYEYNGMLRFTATGLKDKSITNLVIPSCVYTIRESAFRDCTNLRSVTISHGVEIINSYAFRNCSNLKSIIIPDSVRIIGSVWGAVFCECSSLENITIPNSVKEIYWHTFHDCKSLKSITLPDSIKYLGQSMFLGCSSLQSITIPKCVTEIRDGCFWGCSSLKSIIIPDSVASIGHCAFKECSSLSSVTIGNGVESIGDWAFNKCSMLPSIYIPDNVTKMGSWVFEDCSSLKSARISWDCECGEECFPWPCKITHK